MNMAKTDLPQSRTLITMILKNVLNFISKRFYLIYIVITVNLLTISGGMFLAWSSPVIPKLVNESRINENPLGRIITDYEASWIGSLVNVGAMVIPALSSYSMNKIGRKYTIILTGVPYLISSLLLAFCTKIEWYYVARILGGFSLGSTFIVLPMYTAEIAEKHIRGFLGAAMQGFLALGIVFAFSIGPYLSVMVFGIVYASVPILFLILSIQLPESPYYLVRKNKIQEATNVINKTAYTKAVDSIEKDIIEIKVYIKLGSEGRTSDLFTTKTCLTGLIGTCMLMAFQQLSGINSITFYAESLFMDSGTTIPPEVCSIIFGATQLAATMVTPFFVDSFGRKTLAVTSGFLMLISEMPLGVYFYFKESQYGLTELYWVPILCLVIFVFGFNLGFACVPFIFMSEIFPESVKCIAFTISGSLNWFMSFSMTALFMPLANTIHMSGIFFFYGAFNLLAIIFVLLYIPETKEKSLQEIQNMLERKCVRSGEK